MIPTREIYWNVAGLSIAAMYLLILLPAFFLGYGITRRYRMWRHGQEYGPIDRLGERLKTVLAAILLHRRILRPGHRYAGIMHLFIFWGFVVLFLGTLTVLLQADLVGPYLGVNFLQGPFYVAYKLTLNLFGLLFVVGLLMAAFRRYLQAPAKFRVGVTDDAVVLWTLLALGLTGFLLQSERLAASPDPYGPIHWVSYPLSLALAGLGKSTLGVIHAVTWWFHMVTAMLVLAYLPFSKLFHLFGSPVSLFTRSFQAKGALAPIANIEEQEGFGAGKLGDFSWKQLLSVDACMRCARCLDYCPTYNTGKPLKPRQLVQEVAGLMARQGGILTGIGARLPAEVGVRGQEWTPDVETTVATLGPAAQLIGDVVSEEEIWDCTTCGACMEQCPVAIEHVPLIVEMRRHLVLEQSKLPRELAAAFTSLEKRGNPYQISASSRTEWAAGLEVPEIGDVEDPAGLEFLYWVGCSSAYDARNQKVAKALVKVLKTAGVKFAILGKEESCCGDPARRGGNEYLYQILARQNVDLMNGYGVRRIVTGCAHCFNTLKNEYSQFGGSYAVVHHSQLIRDLIRTGRVRLDGAVKGQAMTYHDPCYLGRYNDEYDAPREVLKQPSGELVEMERRRERGFCCGAGGAHAFMDERRGTRISHDRVKEAMSTGAEVVVAACPFCVMMLEDGIRALDAEERFRVRDLAEIVAAALEDPKPSH